MKSFSVSFLAYSRAAYTAEPPEPPVRMPSMPFVLVLIGVLGGAVAFGFIGVFLGPTLLAIGYALLAEWSREPGESFPGDKDIPPKKRRRWLKKAKAPKQDVKTPVS